MPTATRKVLKKISPTVAQNAAASQSARGVLTLSVITMSEIVNQAVPSTWHYRLARVFNASLATLLG
jgi:hypothetical protein